MTQHQDDGRRSGGYEVGYGKPPKATQFKPGQSGNPKGRSPNTLSLAEEASALMDERVAPKNGGRKITRRRQVIQAMYLRAMQGNVGAFRELMRLDAEGLGKRTPRLTSEGQIDEDDAHFLHTLVVDLAANSGRAEEPEDR